MSRTCATAVVMALLIATAAWGSTPHEPPEGGDRWQAATVNLKGTSVHPEASGKVVLACNMAETFHRVQLSAEKVVAGGVYSVWLVKYDAEGKKVLRQSRVDIPQRRLRADRYGKLAFASNLNACPQGKYTAVEIRYHADGKARNVRAAKTALRGKMPRGG